ncbi:hypothetical protein PAMA_016121 [Pampus argenteus]
MKKIYVFFCLLYAAWTEGADIHVEGSEWEKLSFQCSHILARTYSKYFCKDPCKSNKDILVTVVSGGRSQTKRITLVDSGNGVFSVIFNQLRLSDAGTYWCGVQRPGFDTYIEVHLTVKEAVADDTTTVALNVSSIWKYQDISSSTQLISQMETSTKSSVGSNYTDEGKNSTSIGTVFYATAGSVAMIIILVLAMCFRKCRKKQQQVWSNSMDLICKREADCVHGETSEEAVSLKKLDPPTSASTAARCNTPHCTKDAACINCSAGNIQDICHSQSCCDSTELRTGSFWFGLDLSGTI